MSAPLNPVNPLTDAESKEAMRKMRVVSTQVSGTYSGGIFLTTGESTAIENYIKALEAKIEELESKRGDDYWGPFR